MPELPLVPPGAAARALLAGLLSILVLSAASAWPAQAAAAGPAWTAAGAPALQPRDVVEEDEAEEGEGEEQEEGGEEAEAAEAEEEAEEGDEAEGEGAAAGAQAPRCGLLHIAGEAVAVADRLRLELRYATTGGGEATIAYSARGPHGALGSDPTRRVLRRSGTLEVSRHLTPAEARRVHAARAILVRVELAAGPGGCTASDRLVPSSRAGGAGTRSWSDRRGRQ